MATDCSTLRSRLGTCSDSSILSRPNRPPPKIELPNGFNRPTDPTILVVRSKELVTHQAVCDAIKSWMQDAALDVDDFEVLRPEDGPAAKRFIIQFTGQQHLASRALRQAMAAIRQRDNTWRRFFAALPTGGQTDLFISIDKNQVRGLFNKFLRPWLGPGPTSASMCFASWNANALFHFDPSTKSKKFHYLSSLMSPTSIVAVQETHGSEAEARNMIHFLRKPYICHASFLPNAAGGVLTMIPEHRFEDFVVDSSSEPLVQGRVLFTDIQIDGGSAWIAHYNIHNYGLQRHEKIQIANHILGKLQEAKEDPLNKIVVLIGDFNIAAAPPSPVNPASFVAPGEGYLTWRATQDAIWRNLLGKLVEIEQLDPTHVYRPNDTMSIIDRAFTSLPGWALKQFNVCGVTQGLAEVVIHQRLSDHAAIKVDFHPSGQKHHKERAINRDLFGTPEYARFVQAYLQCGDIEQYSPPIRLLFLKTLMKEGARFARNASLGQASDSILGRIILCRSISRAVWRQDLTLGNKLIKAYPLAKQFLQIDAETNRIYLENPGAFADLINSLETTDHMNKIKRLGKNLSEAPESEKKKLRQRLRRLQRRAKLWAPFDRRLLVRGIRRNDQLLSDPLDMASAISEHWGKIFNAKDTPVEKARTYIQRFTGHIDLSRIPPPTKSLMSAILRKQNHSAPGPDCIPYAAWQKTPQALETLSEMMFWLLDGGWALWGFNHLLGTDLPLIASFDFAQAFPSISHRWMLLVLEEIGLPPPLLAYIVLLYQGVICYSEFGGMILFMFPILAGIIQGCPGSGTLFAVSMEPFVADFESTIERKHRGIVRLCADDIGTALIKLQYLMQLFRIFGLAAQLAALHLNLSKCQILPLAGPISDPIKQLYRMKLKALIPSWSAFEIVEVVKYLGMFIGPEAPLPSRVLHGLLRNRIIWLQSGTDYREVWAPSPPRSRARHGALTGAADSTRGIEDLCEAAAALPRRSWMAVSAGAKKAGTDALRAAGADVSDDDVAGLVLKVRSTLNAGRAPRSKLDEARRLEAALDPVAVRLALGNPEVPGSEMAEALWGFTEAATFSTHAESRIRRVAADTDGWEKVADRIWARAVGEDGDTLPVDWVLHLGIGLFLSSLVVVLWADSGRHRLAGAAVGVFGTFLLVRRVPERAVAWWTRWRRRAAFAAALSSGGDGLDLTAAEGDSAAWDAPGAPTPKGSCAAAAEVPTGPMHPPGLAALPPPPWAPPAEGAGAGAATAKPGSQDLAALRAFAQGSEVPGPFSQTAAQQQQQQQQQPQLPPEVAVPAAGLSFHAPHAPADAVKLGREVQMVGATLREFQAQAATNVYWAWHFWERIAAVDGSLGLHPDLRRVLQTHGYVGAGTKSPPGGSLQQELDALLSSATAPHGGGMQASPGWAVAPQTQQQQEDSRWNLSLPPDLRRAAPEIYRTMRGAGAASARDWLSREVTGQRRATVWTDLWTAATNVDYLLGGCKTQSELLTRLASDDALELHLRRLASYVYEMRTKDKVGAAAMLAVRPPGSAADLAPTWLVTEATTHSKAEHQRDERVHAASKLRTRWARRMRVWRRACGLIELMNGMDRGSLEARPAGQRESSDDEMMLAWQLVQQYALQDAARHERDCRGLAPTGGQGTDLACDRGPQDAYTGERKGASRHVTMCAAAVAEPPDDMVVDLLEALPDGERQHYSDERALLGVGARLGALAGAAAPADGAASGVPRTSPPEDGGLEDGDGVDAGPEDAQQHRYDDDWLGQQSSCRAAPPSPAGYSVAEWIEAVKRAKREACGQSGGAFLIEHPEDPGHAPYPSIWNTNEMLDFETRRSSRRARLDQCMLGGRTKKPTCLSGTLQGLEDLNELRCDGPHARESADGKLADGTFRTSPLAQYPEGMCESLGLLIVQTLAIFEQTGLGGTGWRRPPEADRAVTAWSSRSTAAPAVAVRNEDVLRGRGLVLDGPQMAFYLHVDDGVAMAGGNGCGPRATGKMHQLADALAEAGFVVTDRTEASDMQKVLGYAPQARPAQLRLPPKRARELVQQLEAMGATRTLHTEELRSLLGVWIWGALLRRELLCIPSAVFRLLERYPHQRVSTWATVRRELRAMAKVVPLMYADLGAPPAPVHFAADAMGANVEDDGGWGILVTDMDEDIAKDFIDTGGNLGYTVARLDGELTGLRRPEQVIRRTKPFSLLPYRVFKPDEDWTIVGAGRWRTADHITLGEGRCVVKISRLAAATPALHRTVLPILEDNQPVSGAVCKGRSPAHLLNHLLRQKTAAGMASRTKILIPWVETLRQPADKISRKLDSTSVEKVKPHTLAAYGAAAMKFPNWVINLGAKSGTKAKRMQFAIILEQGGVLENLLHRVVLGTPPEGLLFPYSLVDYRHRLKQFEAALGLDIHWTPHSARAGFASDSVARGVPFQDIKEAGRWLTESSLRIYVDVVTASRVLAQAEQRGIAPLIREAAEKLPNYFPEGIFGEGEGIQHAASGLAQGPGRRLGASCGGMASPAPRAAPAQPPAPALGALVDGLLAGPQQPGDAAAGAGAAEAEAPAPAAPGVAALRPPQPLAAQPLATGAAAGQRRARWSSWSLLRAAWLIARWCGRSTSRGVTWAAVAAMMIGWRYVAGPLAHLGTMMGVVASVSVSAGKVVDSSLGAVITAAQGVSDFAVTSSRSLASLLQEAWRGVDITDLHVRQRHAERLADDPEILQAWIQREFLTGEPRPPGAEQVATAISEASVTIPHMAERWQMLIWPGQYRELHMTLDLLPSGFYGVHMVERTVNFTVQWSNPVWSSLDCDISSERDTVVAHINSTLAGLPLPEIRYMSMSDREIQVARLPGAWINMARRL
ncbi:unnamed protein product, partial [Prorocentrum cordatum]